MRVYVTGGGRGFVGGHVVRALEAAGHEVRREWVDVRDAGALAQRIAGCKAVVHVAGLYSFDAAAEELEAVNVAGTRNVVAACLANGVARLVHTSSAVTCGPVAGRAATEDDEPPAFALAVPYNRTKLEAERVVLRAADEGLDACCVNPTTPIGEGDSVPTPTGAMVRGVASGRYRAVLRGAGLNLVDVHDVAAGHVLALERGRAGERYILGGVDLTLEEIFASIARAAGRKAPRIRLSYKAVRLLAAAGAANRHEVRLARLPHWYSSAKAQRELGYRAAPPEEAISRAVSDLRGAARAASAASRRWRSRR